MLDTLKRYSNTWVAKILMGLLILSFGLFGIANVFTNLGTSSVARVGNQSISAVDFDRAYRRQLNDLASQTGRVPTPEQAVAFGIPSAVLGQLTNAAALDQLVEEFGVGASDEMVSEMVSQDPNFATTLGIFDRARFTQTLALSGYTESEYIETQAESVRRAQVVRGLIGGVMAPKTILKITNRVQNDTRTIDYFTISTNILDDIEAPTKEELAAYLTENQTAYRAEAKKQIEILVLTPETLASSLEASEEDLRAEYEKSGQNFLTDETRDVTLLPLADEAQAQLILQGTTQGKSLEEIITENNFDVPTEPLGFVTRSQFEDENIAAAAFDGDRGLSIIDSENQGKVAVLVREIVPATQKDFDEVRDELAVTINLAAAKGIILDKIDEIEELRATLLPINEIAERAGLPTQTVEITASGVGINDVDGLPEGGEERLRAAVNAAEQDKLLPAVTIGANANAWFDLKEVTAARDLTLDEVRDDVANAWRQDKQAEALAAKADEIVAQIKSGNSIADVAEANGQIAMPSMPLTRRGDGMSITSDVASTAFSGGENHVDATRLSDGTYMVFEVTNVIEAPEAEVQDEALTSVSANIADNVYQQFISARRDDAGVSVNQGTLNQLLALDQ